VYLGRGNVDHIVIGPGGIFTIETKSHRGRINAHRVHTRMLKQAYAEGKAIERVVGLKVEPLLVFSNAYLIPAITRRDGVVILPARMLATHLGRRTHRFSAVEVHELHKRLVAAPPN
jgi:hypothetical protein